jgi:hypothetical protein
MASRRTLVLETIFDAGGGSARVLDCLVRHAGRDEGARTSRILRIIEGVSGLTHVQLGEPLRKCSFGLPRRHPSRDRRHSPVHQGNAETMH